MEQARALEQAARDDRAAAGIAILDATCASANGSSQAQTAEARLTGAASRAARAVECPIQRSSTKSHAARRPGSHAARPRSASRPPSPTETRTQSKRNPRLRRSCESMAKPMRTGVGGTAARDTRRTS
jgi:hypothetical protein